MILISSVRFDAFSLSEILIALWLCTNTLVGPVMIPARVEDKSTDCCYFLQDQGIGPFRKIIFPLVDFS